MKQKKSKKRYLWLLLLLILLLVVTLVFSLEYDGGNNLTNQTTTAKTSTSSGGGGGSSTSTDSTDNVWSFGDWSFTNPFDDFSFPEFPTFPSFTFPSSDDQEEESTLIENLDVRLVDDTTECTRNIQCEDICSNPDNAVCIDGVCGCSIPTQPQVDTITPICSDTDGGVITNVKGSCSVVGSRTVLTDSCRGDILTEYSCVDNECRGKAIDCSLIGSVPYSCFEGSCSPNALR